MSLTFKLEPNLLSILLSDIGPYLIPFLAPRDALKLGNICFSSRNEEKIFSQIVNLEFRDYRSYFSLCCSLNMSNERLHFLLNCKSNINMEDQYGITPLSYACWTHNIDLIDTLILNGADLNYPDNEGNAPLMYAVELGDYDIIELLLLRGAYVNHVTEDCNNALTKACRHENTDIVALLVDFGANINFPGDENNDSIWSPLMNACNYNNLDTVQFLIDLGVDINYTIHNTNEECCENAVIIAIINNNIELLNILINANIDLNDIISKNDVENIFEETFENYGYTSVLEYCCRHDDNHFEMIKYVIAIIKIIDDEDFTINIVDRYNETVLFSAVVAENNSNILNFLIQCGINVNHVNENGDTALTHLFQRIPVGLVPDVDPLEDGACERLHVNKINVDKIDFLVKHGSDINHQNNDGNTALIYAAQRNLIDIVREILKFKPNIYHKNKDGKTALDYATEFMHNEIKNLLLF